MRFMLTEEEREYIQDQLYIDLGGVGAVRANLSSALPNYLQLQLPEGLLPGLLIAKAIDLCIEDGYNSQPPTLYNFLRTLLPHDGRVSRVLTRLNAPPPAATVALVDAFDAVLLDTRLPFLGRQSARNYLRALLQASPRQPIVVINGRDDSGKTYTTELIRHARRYHTSVLLCHVEIGEKEGASAGPHELASDIITQLGGNVSDLPARNITNLERWAKDLANWIVNTAEKWPRSWIVLDGFNNDEVRPDTRRLIVHLASAMIKGAALAKHRLILIDYDHTTLTVQPGMIAVDVTEGIKKALVQTFLTQIVAQSGKALDPVQLFERVTRDFAEDPITDLPALARLLNEMIAIVA
jgi:hypothetical protein